MTQHWITQHWIAAKKEAYALARRLRKQGCQVKIYPTALGGYVLEVLELGKKKGV